MKMKRRANSFVIRFEYKLFSTEGFTIFTTRKPAWL